jgi:hypothetical protein
MCDGKECTRAIVDMIKESKDDPLKRIRANEEISGNPYGFIVPKNGDLVFNLEAAEPKPNISFSSARIICLS